MKPRNLLIAVVVLAALSGGVWYAKRHPESGQPASTTPAAPKIAEIPDAQVKQIELTKKGAPTVTLQRQSGKWTITAPEALAADQDAVTGIVSSLSPVTADSVVEDKTSNPSQYGLTNPSLIVKVSEKNGKTATLTFGDDLPAGSLTYAEYDSNPKVYAVSSSVKSSFDKSLNDLRDKRLLTFDSNKLTGISLDSGKGAIDFGKNNQNDWVILKPKPYRADSFQVEDLVRKLGDAKMDLAGSADDQKKAESAFATGTLVGIAKATDASGTETLQVKKNKEDYYGKSSVVKGVYKVSNDVGTEVAKPIDDFRNKKLFDFGFTDPSKVELQQGGSDKAYQKVGQDWKLNGKTIDPASIQAFIDKLRDTAAAKFVDTGFTTPAFTVTVISNDGKHVEKVDFAKVTDGYIAQREGEPALYQLDGKPVDDILRAGSDIKEATTKKK
ncbi:MAG TPA: DUF4340 domain-containing protein [Bryobacteraceae bacterium]|jgi:hypothetical protein|nr:DUF4340 domain-containing protein [Bryobacteraceae bacterium]